MSTIWTYARPDCTTTGRNGNSPLYICAAPIARATQYGRYEQNGRGCYEQTDRRTWATLLARACPDGTHESLRRTYHPGLSRTGHAYLQQPQRRPLYRSPRTQRRYGSVETKKSGCNLTFLFLHLLAPSGDCTISSEGYRHAID